MKYKQNHDGKSGNDMALITGLYLTLSSLNRLFTTAAVTCSPCSPQSSYLDLVSVDFLPLLDITRSIENQFQSRRKQDFDSLALSLVSAETST